MRKNLLFTFLTLISLKSEVNAQNLPQAYLDSVKLFYSSWVENQTDFVYTVMDNTSFQSLDNLFAERISTLSLFKSPCTVYKIDRNKTKKTMIFDINEKRKYCSDSIILTENETNWALEKLKQSKSFKWTKYFFPMAEIIDSSSYFSKFENRTNKSQKPDYWKVGLPFFFRNGTYSMIHYIYYCGSLCGYEGLVVYKNEAGHWNKFGTLYEGVF